MRSLVTGAAGFVGRHLTADLLSRGHRVAGVVHPTDRGSRALGDRVEEHVLDVVDDGAFEEVVRWFRPDAIFHLAAFSNPEGSWKEARRTLETNILGAHQVLRAAVAAEKSPTVLLVGSAQQYGEVPPAEQPIREDRVLQPLTPYAVSKTTQELLGLRSFRSDELPVLCTRSFNHTGPGQSDAYVCSALARQIVEVERGIREPVIRAGNLEARRDFTDVRDVAGAYVAMVERGRPGRVYNVCSGEAVSIREALETLIGFARARVEVAIDPNRYHSLDVPLMLGDPSRLEEETGWSRRHSFAETLRDLLEDWRKRL
jgi:GDP-4-dehydro-6-deoxy-D-mannose reductase